MVVQSFSMSLLTKQFSMIKAYISFDINIHFCVGFQSERDILENLFLDLETIFENSNNNY